MLEEPGLSHPTADERSCGCSRPHLQTHAAYAARPPSPTSHSFIPVNAPEQLDIYIKTGASCNKLPLMRPLTPLNQLDGMASAQQEEDLRCVQISLLLHQG